jgi:transglutaminase-like putative cysteine protease
MPTDAAFRLSLYLTLALSCACLGYAEHDLFPGVPFIAGAAVVALGVLYRLETRVQLLSLPDANRLGLVLGLGYFAWAAYRLVRVLRSPEMGDAGMQLVVVALFGPLLMLLMPAKLARREKHAGDYWGLYGAALVATALAGAMAEDAVTFVLIGFYAAAAVWSLTLFHLRRSAGEIAPIPNRPAPPAVGGVLAAGPPAPGVGRALRLGAAAVAVAVPLYLLTPRSPADKLEFGKPRVEVGFAADQMVNLNQTGTLRENHSEAFEVLATANGAPKTDLPEGVRWRGRVLRQYANGTWQLGDLPMPTVDLVPRTAVSWEPPHFGPGDCTLAFAVPWRLTAQFLAEPVWWAADRPVPVASITDSGPQPWGWLASGSFFWNGRTVRGEVHNYVQVWPSDADPDLSPPFHLVESRFSTAQLVHNPVRRVKEYADALVERMEDAGELPANYRDIVTLLPRRQYHDRIARAFTKHLATSREFTYTLELRRERKDLDPVEEFLFHTRAGHCERFASALALMLRSQGIPAVLVLGFKGCEPTDEPGRYVVKQEHAHAWVDALIVDSGQKPLGPGERPVSRWRSLDPTPAGSPVASGHEAGLGGLRAWAGDMFREYVTDYSPEQRRKAIAAVGAWLARPGVWGTAAAVGLLVAAARRVRRRLSAAGAVAESVPPFLVKLLAVLAARGLVPHAGETPREFAGRVGEALRRSPVAAAVAGVPGDWAEAYYETRFGGRPLPPHRLDSLEAGLEELERTLRNHPV